MARRKSKNYLNNRDLYDQIVLSKEQDELTRTAVKMLTMLAERAQRKLKYANPQDQEDCLSFAILDLMKYWRSFKPEKTTNAFSYFTSMCMNGYAKGWHKLHPKKYKGTISLSNSNGDGIYSI